MADLPGTYGTVSSQTATTLRPDFGGRPRRPKPALPVPQTPARNATIDMFVARTGKRPRDVDERHRPTEDEMHDRVKEREWNKSANDAARRRRMRRMHQLNTEKGFSLT